MHGWRIGKEDWQGRKHHTKRDGDSSEGKGKRRFVGYQIKSTLLWEMPVDFTIRTNCFFSNISRNSWNLIILIFVWYSHQLQRQLTWQPSIALFSLYFDDGCQWFLPEITSQFWAGSLFCVWWLMLLIVTTLFPCNLFWKRASLSFLLRIFLLFF